MGLLRLCERVIAVGGNRVGDIVVARGRTRWRDETLWKHDCEGPRSEVVDLPSLLLLGVLFIQQERSSVLDLEHLVLSGLF